MRTGRGVGQYSGEGGEGPVHSPPRRRRRRGTLACVSPNTLLRVCACACVSLNTLMWACDAYCVSVAACVHVCVTSGVRRVRTLCPPACSVPGYFRFFGRGGGKRTVRFCGRYPDFPPCPPRVLPPHLLQRDVRAGSREGWTALAVLPFRFGPLSLASLVRDSGKVRACWRLSVTVSWVACVGTPRMRAGKSYYPSQAELWVEARCLLWWVMAERLVCSRLWCVFAGVGVVIFAT